jgi:hypothetical protein
MLVFPLAHDDLFGRSQLLQQLADVARAQGIFAFTIDAPIFATPRPLYEREPHGLVAFRAGRGLRGDHGAQGPDAYGDDVRYRIPSKLPL